MTIPLRFYLYSAAIVLVVLYIYRCEHKIAAHESFVEQQRILAHIAEQDASDAIKEGISNKERTDDEIKRNRALITSLSRSLHDARSSRGYLPTPAPGTPDPDRITFSRAELIAAIRQLDTDLSQIALKGDEALAAIQSLREWARDIQGRE